MSVLNSIFIVSGLTGLVVVILLRALKKDYARYDNEVGMLEVNDFSDEYGWKQIHADVFRAPRHLTWLSTFYGIGMQLIFTLLILFFMALVGHFYEERGRTLSVFIFLYSISSLICGHQGGILYNRYGGRNWMKTMIISSSLLPIIISVNVILGNFFSLSYSSSKSISFGNMVANVTNFSFQCLAFGCL